ncbi:adhesion G protein-coupled receptor F4 isoform X3 [Marmota marmota marmota]|uniref:adhesion G protein-coupled receptor F4 isoform X3 n=1 Tax=Marmota marmota marmota TaxID=9994 RepID=UPI002093D959|nr:adhesion G protein-coupled receptor F4 isoform X3 [Marmota marmota marmota]
MKSQATMICCVLFFLATECSHHRPKNHIKDRAKLQNFEGKPGTGRIQEKCHEPCLSSTNCSQPCAKHFRGEIGFICHQKKWQKLTETCTSLSVETLFKSYSEVANHILDTAAISNWPFIPDKNASSNLLQSVNSFASQLHIHNESEDIVDELFIQMKGFHINHNTTKRSFNFSMSVDNTTESILGMIEIPRQELQKLPPGDTFRAISIAFPTLGAILKEPHLPNESVSRPINGLVLSVILPETMKEILFTFEKVNKSRSTRAQCVGWHSQKRMWDKNQCKKMVDTMDKVKCHCNYTNVMMSFSILMSPKSVSDKALDYITGIGLSLSILSLVLCLIIEATVWSRVVMTEISYMHHVCIVNIAVSLLIANVWFIIGSNFTIKSQEDNWCVTVTFFSHFFYLSLFFWMLFKALLIIYGILVIFRRMMKSHMMVIGFAIGYGCPLVIAVTTVAITEPQKGYVRCDACWLNWDNTKALFAFVIPALVIVAVNLLVVLVVAINTQRPSIGSSKSQDMAIIMRISKNVAILTPLLGLTWGFGIVILIEETSLIFHIIFAVLNAFQGFFILLFGTIMDHKIRDALRMRMSSLKGKSRAAENASLSPTNGSKLMNR